MSNLPKGMPSNFKSVVKEIGGSIKKVKQIKGGGFRVTVKLSDGNCRTIEQRSRHPVKPQKLKQELLKFAK